MIIIFNIITIANGTIAIIMINIIDMINIVILSNIVVVIINVITFLIVISFIFLSKIYLNKMIPTLDL